jgi:hypothetical protein
LKVWILVFFIFAEAIYERWCNVAVVLYAQNERYQKRVGVVVNVEIIIRLIEQLHN